MRTGRLLALSRLMAGGLALIMVGSVCVLIAGAIMPEGWFTVRTPWWGVAKVGIVIDVGLAGTGLLMVAVDVGLDIYREERGVEPN